MKKKWLLLITLGLALILSLLGCTPTQIPTTSKPSPTNSTPTSTTAVQPTFSSSENKTGWTTFTINNGPPTSNVTTSVIQDDQGIIWVGSFRGLWRFDGSRWEIYPDSLGNASILCATRDKNGNLWFGTSGDGAYEYTGKEWLNFTPGNTSKGLPGEEVASILGDSQGNVWLASIGQVGQRLPPISYGVTRYDGTEWASFLDRTDVTTIFQDDEGNLWFGTNTGVIRYDGSDWRTFTTADGLVDGYVIAITQDNQGNMWFGTWADGVSRYDGENWRTFTPEDGLGSDAIHAMLKDSRGNLWFGSYSIHGYYGISRFDGTQWQHFDPWQSEDDKYHYNVISIFEDNEGNIWFTTSFGLVRYNPEGYAK